MAARAQVANLLTAASLLMAAGAVGFAFRRPAPVPDHAGGIAAAPTPASHISITNAPSMGDPGARFALVEFADFQCSFCAAFARETLPALKRAYIDTGRLRFVYLHMPLPPIHAVALSAAEAAECAHRQGRFWPLHDVIFERQDRLERASLRTFALETGVDPPRFDRCVAGEARATVAEHTAISFELDIRGTPAFFLGSVDEGRLRIIQRLQGAKPLAAFTAAIDALLARGAE